MIEDYIIPEMSTLIRNMLISTNLYPVLNNFLQPLNPRSAGQSSNDFSKYGPTLAGNSMIYIVMELG